MATRIISRAQSSLGIALSRARDRLPAADSAHRRIARGTLLVGLLMLATRVVFALREMALAWRYGTSATADAFQLALTINTWAAAMVTSVATVVLVPRLVALRTKPEAYWPFVAELNGKMLCAALILAAAIWIGAPLAVEAMAGPLPSDTRALALGMTRLMAPVGALTLLIGYLATRLQAREQFRHTAVEALPAVAVALFVLATPADSQGAPLVYGMLAGLALQAGWLAAMTRRSEGSLGSLSLRRRSAEWQSLYGAVLTMAAGQVVLGVVMPIDQAFAASLGSGAVAAFGYAGRVVALLLTIATVVVGRALLPVLSQVASNRDHEQGRQLSYKWAGLMFALGLLAVPAGWWLAPWGVQILFQRGAFGTEASALVTEIVRYGLIQLPFYFGSLVLVQWLAALRRYDVLLWGGLLALAVKIALNFALAPEWGMAGLMAANAGMYLTSFACHIWFARNAHERSGEDRTA